MFAVVVPYAPATPTRDRTQSMSTTRHIPVMVDEVLHYLLHERSRTIVDGTVGFGGHAEAMLRARAELSVIGVDRDPDAIASSAARLSEFGERVSLVQGLYSDLETVCAHIRRVDGVLLDLGVSSAQLDEPGRGFGYGVSGPLDMRMGQEGQSAAELIARSNADELAAWLREYGEVRQARRIARGIRYAVERNAMTSTGELRAAVVDAVGHGVAPAELSRVFQAVRIAVNGELAHLRRFLDGVLDHMNPGARLVVISYHSLEDRMVKHFMRDASATCVCPPSVPVCVCGRSPRIRMLTRRAIGPRQEEVKRNPRSRSAKLRAAEKIDGNKT